MDYNQAALEMHEARHGKVAVQSKVKVENRDDLSTAYTPGVAEPCRRIHANPRDVYRYTAKGNLVAVVSDGTAVLGLGDIGPLAAMPVMEGKAILFKEFADVDAFPICLDTKDVDEIVRTVKALAPTFGGINLEDISAPRCFEIESRLRQELDIPVFHDDQHGTAIVVSAGLLNALRLVGKKMEDVNIVINGAGSAGISIAKLLMQFGAGNIVLVDRAGAVSVDEDWLNPAQRKMAEITNRHNERGPLCDVIRGKDVFGGINLEDISAPRCFEIESRLRQELDIPVFHDDQHGTAIVVSAGLLNALRLVGKKMEDVNIVINGAGSAGISIAKLLMQFGAGNIVLVDRAGAVSVDEDWLNPAQRKMAEITNRHNERGPLCDVIRGKDVFIGVSAPHVVTAEMVSTMAKDAIVFAMANPTPEIMPEEAAKGGARVIATGRSDYPNQINNVLVFPGIFRGALDAQATDITEEMKLSAARAIASIVTDEELKEDYIIPGAFDKRVAPAVAKAVMDCARAQGVSKLDT